MLHEVLRFFWINWNNLLKEEAGQEALQGTSLLSLTQRTPGVKVKAGSHRSPWGLPLSMDTVSLYFMDRGVFISLASVLSRPTCIDFMYLLEVRFQVKSVITECSLLKGSFIKCLHTRRNVSSFIGCNWATLQQVKTHICIYSLQRISSINYNKGKASETEKLYMSKEFNDPCDPWIPSTISLAVNSHIYRQLQRWRHPREKKQQRKQFSCRNTPGLFKKWQGDQCYRSGVYKREN